MMRGYSGGFGMAVGWIVGIIVVIITIRFLLSETGGAGSCCSNHSKGHNDKAK